jgi:predicted RecA/RadA family phage recombinase
MQYIVFMIQGDLGSFDAYGVFMLVQQSTSLVAHGERAYVSALGSCGCCIGICQQP